MRLHQVLILAAALWLVLPTAASAQPAATVNMANNSFSRTEVDISAGSTVVWSNANPRTHTVTADDGSFDSGDVATGQQFSMEFDTPGTYPYYCQYHGDVGGVGMSGVIVVS
jgi:plastocyanin